MNGQIARLIRSTEWHHHRAVMDIFHHKFQRIEGWTEFLHRAMPQGVVGLLEHSSLQGWSVRSFHALYIACWIHHPVEKGSYMLNLSGLNETQRHRINLAVVRNCVGRPSSHLSKNGYSAANGWTFLKNYRELLVQVESSGGCHLFLKAEGYLVSDPRHLMSWQHKNGDAAAGLPCSKYLRDFATSHPDFVESRGAENFSHNYKALVKGLGLKNEVGKSTKLVTVRSVIKALFEQTGYIDRVPCRSTFFNVASNEQLGIVLQSYCTSAYDQSLHNPANLITPAMVAELRRLAINLRTQGEVKHAQVFQEIRVTPAEVQRSVDTFKNVAVGLNV